MGDKKAYRGDMKFHYKDIDMAVKQHIKDEIAFEKSKNIEDLIFFSSHTISLKVFKDGTRKLKKKLKNFDLMEVSFFEEEIERFIFEHHLHVELNSEKYLYLCKALLKAHIVINPKTGTVLLA